MRTKYRLVGAAREDEVLLILYGAVEYLSAVAEALPEECLLIISGGRYADYEFVCVGFHGLLEEVVLFRLFVGVYFVAYRNVAVK